jgi:hypothetical protein
MEYEGPHDGLYLGWLRIYWQGAACAVCEAAHDRIGGEIVESAGDVVRRWGRRIASGLLGVVLRAGATAAGDCGGRLRRGGDPERGGAMSYKVDPNTAPEVPCPKKLVFLRDHLISKGHTVRIVQLNKHGGTPSFVVDGTPIRILDETPHRRRYFPAGDSDPNWTLTIRPETWGTGCARAQTFKRKTVQVPWNLNGIYKKIINTLEAERRFVAARKARADKRADFEVKRRAIGKKYPGAFRVLHLEQRDEGKSDTAHLVLLQEFTFEQLEKIFALVETLVPTAEPDPELEDVGDFEGGEEACEEVDDGEEENE